MKKTELIIIIGILAFLPSSFCAQGKSPGLEKIWWINSSLLNDLKNHDLKPLSHYHFLSLLTKHDSWHAEYVGDYKPIDVLKGGAKNQYWDTLSIAVYDRMLDSLDLLTGQKGNMSIKIESDLSLVRIAYHNDTTKFIKAPNDKYIGMYSGLIYLTTEVLVGNYTNLKDTIQIQWRGDKLLFGDKEEKVSFLYGKCNLFNVFDNIKAKKKHIVKSDNLNLYSFQKRFYLQMNGETWIKIRGCR